MAQAGEDVVFIARGEHLKAIRERGLKVDSIAGDFVIHPAEATDDPTQVGAVDAVILGVKGWQVPEAAEAIRPMVGPASRVHRRLHYQAANKKECCYGWVTQYR